MWLHIQMLGVNATPYALAFLLRRPGHHNFINESTPTNYLQKLNRTEKLTYMQFNTLTCKQEQTLMNPRTEAKYSCHIFNVKGLGLTL